MFKRSPKASAVKSGLPEGRKALVERYMIDAEEAEQRSQREAAQAEARRAAEDRARREPAEVESELVAHRAADGGPTEQREPATDGFPIYDWLQRSGPAPTADWPRSLVDAKQESRRGDDQPA